jgi:hypothetical protein
MRVTPFKRMLALAAGMPAPGDDDDDDDDDEAAAEEGAAAAAAAPTAERAPPPPLQQMLGRLEAEVEASGCSNPLDCKQGTQLLDALRLRYLSPSDGYSNWPEWSSVSPPPLPRPAPQECSSAEDHAALTAIFTRLAPLVSRPHRGLFLHAAWRHLTPIGPPKVPTPPSSRADTPPGFRRKLHAPSADSVPEPPPKRPEPEEVYLTSPRPGNSRYTRSSRSSSKRSKRPDWSARKRAAAQNETAPYVPPRVPLPDHLLRMATPKGGGFWPDKFFWPDKQPTGRKARFLLMRPDGDFWAYEEGGSGISGRFNWERPWETEEDAAAAAPTPRPIHPVRLTAGRSARGSSRGGPSARHSELRAQGVALRAPDFGETPASTPAGSVQSRSGSARSITSATSASAAAPAAPADGPPSAAAAAVAATPRGSARGSSAHNQRAAMEVVGLRSRPWRWSAHGADEVEWRPPGGLDDAPPEADGGAGWGSRPGSRRTAARQASPRAESHSAARVESARLARPGARPAAATARPRPMSMLDPLDRPITR